MTDQNANGDEVKTAVAALEKERWSSLEVAKLSVPLIGSLIISIVVLGVGESYKHEAAKVAAERETFETAQNYAREREAKLIEKRFQLWDELAPRMNDVYAYFLYVGHWKELSAKDLIVRKREMDHLVFSYRPFFSDEFFTAYIAFTDAAYQPFGGWRADAGLKTSNEHRGDPEPNRFVGGDHRDEIHEAYYRVMRAAAKELKLQVATPTRPKDPGQP
jgi:hypothetical protein